MSQKEDALHSPAGWGPRLGGMIALFFLVLLLMFPSNPLLSLPGQDNGVFLYGGQQVLEGRLPYVDFWDHKGPWIYYINALGLALGDGSRWGVWIVELCFLMATAFLIFKLLRELGDWALAITGSIAWFYGMSRVGSYVHFQDSNYTETYALLFALGILYFWASPSEFLKNDALRYFLIGFMGGCSFFLRPNNIGLFMGIALFEIARHVRNSSFREMVKKLATLGSGFAAAILPWLLYFYWRGGLFHLLDSVFVYNYIYSQDRNASFVEFFVQGIALMSGLPLIGYLLLLAGYLVHVRSGSSSFTHEKLALLLLIGWPVEVVLSSLSKRILLHYYVTWTPFLALSGVLGLLLLTRAQGQKRKTYFWQVLTASATLLIMFLHSIDILSYFSMTRAMLENRRNGIQLQSAIAQRIDAITQPEDEVLVWGNEVWINVLSDRRSPTKYVYQYPLFLQGYSDGLKVASFLDDIQQRPPALIIEPVVDTDEIFPLSIDRRTAIALKRKMPEGMGEVFDFIDRHYCVVAIYNDITVYQLIELVDDEFPCLNK